MILANEVWNVTANFSQAEIAIREMIAWNYEWIQHVKAETECMDGGVLVAGCDGNGPNESNVDISWTQIVNIYNYGEDNSD